MTMRASMVVLSIAPLLPLLLPAPAPAGARAGARAGASATTGAAAETARYNLPGKPPYLVAHYMLWYSTPWSTINGSQVDRTSDAWSHWKWNGAEARHDPERRLANGQRDIASVAYPLIGPYDSGSRAVIRYHLATAKAAGVSIISSIWYGPGSNTDKRLPIVLEEAERLGMRVMICYEEKINFPTYRHPRTREEIVRTAGGDLEYILRTYARHPAYLRRNDLPVIQQFNGAGAGELGPKQLTPDEFIEIFQALPGKVAYIRQNLSDMYHPPIAGAYVWWAQNDWPAKFARHAAELRAEGRLEFIMTMVCPGFDDTGVWGWGNGPRKSRGYGLDVLARTMDQALVGEPELVQMVTWNDFNESTCFEPTTQHGYAFLDAMEQWWGKQVGREVDLEDNRLPFEAYHRSCSATERAQIPVATQR